MTTPEIFSEIEVPQGRPHSTLLANNFTSRFSTVTRSTLQFAPPNLSQNGEPISSSSTPIEMLVVGAGIAGPLLSLFVSQSEVQFNITVLERAPNGTSTGQQIDIRGAGTKILNRYLPELLKEIKEATTDEAGFNFLDQQGNVAATFPVQKDNVDSYLTSPTSEIEILRGNLAKLLIDASQNPKYKREGTKVKYIYGDMVNELAVSPSGKVNVTLASGSHKEYDLVVGADGMRSSIRRLAFKDSQDALKSLGQYTSYFTIPYEPEDGTFASWFNAPLGRCILLRPDNAGYTRAYLSIMASDSNRKVLENYHSLSTAEQKKMLRALFEDSKWKIDRILKGMDESDDFYLQEIAQVQIPTWSTANGQIVLLGDAGYCPSPISGMGTTLAVVGAYILAGELVTSIRAQTANSQGKMPKKLDFEKASQHYDIKMRPFVEKGQAILPGAPAIANPMTSWGIEVLLRVVGVVSWLSRSPIAKLFSWVGGFFASKEKEWDDKLDQYEFVKR
jgi:2-polyprenyl-6-methoxyphenol hydroxylase-like FAD-dependent oxidoreductase